MMPCTLMKICNRSMGLFLAATVLTIPSMAFTNRQPACTRSCIPNRNYGHNSAQASVREFAVANAPAILPGSVKKPFHFRELKLDLAHLQLSEVGLTIDGIEGNLIASGRLAHSGGDGGMKGSNVMIRIRAFIATSTNAIQLPPDARQLPPDAVAVWQSEQKIWVPVGNHHFSLVPAVQSLSQRDTLRKNFNAITHIEVEMEYLLDR
jgi:hypothetical protein